MLGLYLIASHMAGDYLFQSAWMAGNKLHNRFARICHVIVYTGCFIPVAIIYGNNVTNINAFLILLGIFHYLTDSKRWRTSNPWPAMPILQDQSLHIVQLAILGGLFLDHSLL